MEDPASPSTPIAAGPDASEAVICPHCGLALEVENPAEQQLILCPSCQTEFVRGKTDEGGEPPLSYERPADSFDELSGLHIRQLVQLRRSAIRARSYAIIIMLCCLVMGAQLVLTDMQEVHSYGWDRWAILYAISALVMAVVAALSSQKAGVLHRESKVSFAPTAEPDYLPQFDDLSDGSQRVKNLEEMMNDEP